MDSKTKQAIAALVLGVSALSGSPADYLTRLHVLAGNSYSAFTCSTYIETAKRIGHCGAAGMFSGCNGQMNVIAEFASTSEINFSTLHAGDVLDFGGRHVAAFAGDAVIDSDPSHDGVGKIDLRTKSRDPWFAGPVRVLRFKS